MDGRRSLLVILVVCFLLVLASGKGCTDPRCRPNLSPFDQWHSAYDCLQNTSASCPNQYQLTPVGWVNVSVSDTASYCKEDGCAVHTGYLLQCLDGVMRGNYKFQSKQTVEDLRYTITEGCLKGFTGKALTAPS